MNVATPYTNVTMKKKEGTTIREEHKARKEGPWLFINRRLPAITLTTTKEMKSPFLT